MTKAIAATDPATRRPMTTLLDHAKVEPPPLRGTYIVEKHCQLFTVLRRMSKLTRMQSVMARLRKLPIQSMSLIFSMNLPSTGFKGTNSQIKAIVATETCGEKSISPAVLRT